MSSLEGKPAPQFELAGSDGKTHRLADHGGKTVAIYFYPRDNTPGCTKEACGFRDLKPRLDSLGVILYGVSRDSLNSHDRFIGDFGLFGGALAYYLVKTKANDRIGKWAPWILVAYLLALIPVTLLPGRFIIIVAIGMALVAPLGVWIDRHRSLKPKPELTPLQ